MLTQDSVVNMVRDYAQEIEGLGLHLRKVFLFGSFASGVQHEWSDIDVALVADEFKGLPQDMRLFSRIGSKKPYVRIEALTYPTDYFLQSDPFIEEIKKTGIVIKE
jgi:predicted nucleotidyltransferase